MDEGLPKITRRMFGKLAAGVIAQPQIGKEALAEAVGSLGTEPQGLEQKVARLTHFFLDKNSLVDPGEIEGALNVSKRLTSTALSGHDRWRVNLERFERLFHVTPRDMSLGDFTEEILSRAKGFVPDELLDEYRPENVRKLADEPELVVRQNVLLRNLAKLFSKRLTYLPEDHWPSRIACMANVISS